eukprot:1509808-Prymnesium_polylepis.1
MVPGIAIPYDKLVAVSGPSEEQQPPMDGGSGDDGGNGLWDEASRAAALLSVLGDLLIILTTTLGARRRRQFTCVAASRTRRRWGCGTVPLSRHAPAFATANPRSSGILRAMSIADLVTSSAMVVNGKYLRGADLGSGTDWDSGDAFAGQTNEGSFWCDAVAVLFWYGAWAAWLWNA